MLIREIRWKLKKVKRNSQMITDDPLRWSANMFSLTAVK